MAIKFHVPDGSETDMVINSLKFFPVSSGADFRDMLLAVAESPPDAPKPTKLDQFAASHPAMPRALATVQTPDSFADEEYYGVNAFILVNDKGERHAVRYIMAPEKLVHLSSEEAAKTAPDFLIDELPGRIARRPVTSHLKAQLTSPGDSTKDASIPGPRAMRSWNSA
jgi:catalase